MPIKLDAENWPRRTVRSDQGRNTPHVTARGRGQETWFAMTEANSDTVASCFRSSHDAVPRVSRRLRTLPSPRVVAVERPAAPDYKIDLTLQISQNTQV
jgi:hypothetical protein